MVEFKTEVIIQRKTEVARDCYSFQNAELLAAFFFVFVFFLTFS